MWQIMYMGMVAHEFEEGADPEEILTTLKDEFDEGAVLRWNPGED